MEANIKNAAPTAMGNGAKTSIETVQSQNKISPEWVGAPAIILRHFCGVTV